MQTGLRCYSAATIKRLTEAVKEQGYTRYSLARELCERGQWQNDSGRLCFGPARRALPLIARRVGIKLPEPCEMRLGQPGLVVGTDYPDKTVCCGLEQLGGVSLEIGVQQGKPTRRTPSA